jgi:hypothetical protein
MAVLTHASLGSPGRAVLDAARHPSHQATELDSLLSVGLVDLMAEPGIMDVAMVGATQGQVLVGGDGAVCRTFSSVLAGPVGRVARSTVVPSPRWDIVIWEAA